MKKTTFMMLATTVAGIVSWMPQVHAAEVAEGVSDSVRLGEVVVTGSRQAVDVRHLPMTVTVINRDKLTEQNHTSLLPTVMQQVPGFFVTGRSVMGYGVSTGAAGGINLRGLAGGSGQMLVLIDGHPQYQGVFGHPISDSYQTLMAERVEVLRGPASVLYGSNAMGGVMNIVTRQVKTDTVSTIINIGAGSYGTLQAEATNQLRHGRFSSTVALQYARSDNHRPNMGFEQYGGYIKLGYDLDAHWTLSADLDLTRFNASNPGTTTQPKLENDQWITRGAASLTLANNYGSTSGALSVYDNFGWHKINDGYNAQGGTPQTDLFRSKDAVAGVTWYQTARLFSGNRVTVGVDYQHIYGRAYYTNRQTGETVTTQRRLMQSAHAHENEVAGYVDFRQDLTPWLTADAGLRYDHHSKAGGEWVPQFGLAVRPMTTASLKATVGKGFRNPTTKEMYLYGMANHDSLRAERLWNYELAWSHHLGRLNYGANIYYIKADNMIMSTATAQGNKNMNTGELEHYGMELQAGYDLCRRWTLTTNHSILKMKNRDVTAAPKYKAFLGGTYHDGKWHATLGLQYLSGLGLDSNGDGFADEAQKDICLVNASVRYNLCPNLALWARGENLLAQRYELYNGYPMPRATFMGGVNIAF